MAAVPSNVRPSEIKRLDRHALVGVLLREVINFRSFWKSTTFSSTVEPTIYLLAFGFGFGALLNKAGGDQYQGRDYVDFVATGTVATAVMFSSVFSSMFGSFFKANYQHTYDALLAAPVDTEEIVTAEALWIGLRAGVYGCMPMLVGMVFGLNPSVGMLMVPFIAFCTGFGWSCFGSAVAATLKSVDHFSYVTSICITPLFLCAGSFFPIDTLPEGVQIAAQFNPLYHCVQLVRGFVFGTIDLKFALYHFGVIWLFGLVMWRIAIIRATKKLVI
jgi:lipooligosaccharide transport system permease protein